jgi:hypothetical protein
MVSTKFGKSWSFLKLMGSGAHGSKIDGFPGTKIYPKSIAQEKTHKTVLMTKLEKKLITGSK